MRQKSDANIDSSVLNDSSNKLSESEFVCWCIDRTNMDIGDEDENDERSMLEGKKISMRPDVSSTYWFSSDAAPAGLASIVACVVNQITLLYTHSSILPLWKRYDLL